MHPKCKNYIFNSIQNIFIYHLKKPNAQKSTLTILIQIDMKRLYCLKMIFTFQITWDCFDFPFLFPFYVPLIYDLVNMFLLHVRFRFYLE